MERLDNIIVDAAFSARLPLATSYFCARLALAAGVGAVRKLGFRRVGDGACCHN